MQKVPSAPSPQQWGAAQPHMTQLKRLLRLVCNNKTRYSQRSIGTDGSNTTILADCSTRCNLTAIGPVRKSALFKHAIIIEI